MHKTLFDYRILKWMAYVIGSVGLFLSRWKATGKMPDERKTVFIAAPHTSNWDFVFTLLIAFKLKVNIYWMGKSSLFEGWSGPIMRFLGGIPVYRSKKTNMVDQMVQVFNEREDFNLVVPPEGTRNQVSYWKTGFYYIAVNSKVPIILGYLDFKKRQGGIGPTFFPTGNIDADMEEIKKFYNDIEGKKSENFAKGHVPLANSANTPENSDEKAGEESRKEAS